MDWKGNTCLRSITRYGVNSGKIAICKKCNYAFEYPVLGSKKVLCEDCDQQEFPELLEVKEFFEQVSQSDRSVTDNFDFQPTSGNTFNLSPKIKSFAQLDREYIEHVNRVQNVQVSKITLRLPRQGSKIGINHIGDIHIGTDACVYNAFKDIINFVLENDDEYAVFQGDLVDILTSQSVGVLAEQSQTIRDQIRLVRGNLLPLARAHKILWMLRGNHEDRLDKATRNIVDITQGLADDLDVLYLQTEGYTRIESSGVGYNSYNIHGFNAGSTAGARRNKMAHMLTKFPSADIITSGHNHLLDVIQTTDEYIDINTGRRHPKPRYGLYTGTLHSYMGYGADYGLTQGPLGFGRVEFDVDHGYITPRVMQTLWMNGKYLQTFPY